MSLLKEVCILFNRNLSIKDINKGIKNLKFDNLQFRELVFDNEYYAIYQNEIYSGYLSISLFDRNVSFDIILLNSEKSYLKFKTTTRNSTEIVDDNVEYVLNVFKKLLFLDVITYISELDDISGIYDYEEIKVFRSMNFYWC